MHEQPGHGATQTIDDPAHPEPDVPQPTAPTSVLAGVALVGIACYLIFGGGSFEARRAKRTAQGIPFFTPEEHPVQPLIAGAALLGGLLLVFRSVGAATASRPDADPAEDHSERPDPPREHASRH